MLRLMPGRVKDLLLAGPRPWTDPRSFGARADGSSDDYPAIQYALDRAGRAGGGLVMLPSGVCVITAGLRIPSGVTLAGMGMGATTVRVQSGANVHAIQLSTTNDKRCTIRDLTIDGNKAGNLSSGAGILLDNNGVSGDVSHIVENILVSQTRQQGVYLAPGVRNATFSKVNCYEGADDGWYVAHGATDNRFFSCVAGNNRGHGFHIFSPNNYFDSCVAFGSGAISIGTSYATDKDGWLIEPPVGQIVVGISLVNCVGQENGRNGLYIWGNPGQANTGLESIAVLNFLADSNREGGTLASGAGVGIQVDGGTVGNRNIRGVHIQALARNSSNLIGRQTHGLKVVGDMNGSVFDVRSVVTGDAWTQTGRFDLSAAVTGTFTLLGGAALMIPEKAGTPIVADFDGLPSGLIYDKTNNKLAYLNGGTVRQTAALA